jgi:hypothetical protein
MIDAELTNHYALRLKDRVALEPEKKTLILMPSLL